MSRQLLKKSPSLEGHAQSLVKAGLARTALDKLAQAALAEDIGDGDVSSAVFSGSETGTAELLAKSAGVLSGSGIFSAVFRQVDPRVRVRWQVKDGEPFKKGAILAHLKGPLPSLLQGERVALNFIQRLSGVATMTASYVKALGARADEVGIYDTRKTTPLMRALEKKAVTDGGGRNHRFALYDMAMLKNNHIDAAGGIAEAVQRLQDAEFFQRKPRLGLCIEVRDLEEAVEAAWCRADIIMFDNMTPAQVRSAATAVNRECADLKLPVPQFEYSGGVTLATLKSLRNLPIQRISVGAITHSVPSADIALHFK